MTRLIPFLVLVALLITGCGAKLQDITAKHGATARTELAKLNTVLDHCRALAPLKQEKLPENLPGVVFADPLDRPQGNARTIWLQAHDDPAIVLDPVHGSYRKGDNWWWNTSQA